MDCSPDFKESSPTGGGHSVTVHHTLPTPPAPGFCCRFAPISIWRGDLPHLEQTGVTTFVTFRLKDSLPAEKLAELRVLRDEWMRAHPIPGEMSIDEVVDYRRFVGGTVEKWLDAGHGSCPFRHAEQREIVENAILHFNGVRYWLYAFVVMPNHVHVLFTPTGNFTVRDIVRSWKKFSATAVRRMVGGTGAFWEDEYWDTLMRDGTHFRRALNYTVRNSPLVAWSAYHLPVTE